MAHVSLPPFNIANVWPQIQGMWMPLTGHLWPNMTLLQTFCKTLRLKVRRQNKVILYQPLLKKMGNSAKWIILSHPGIYAQGKKDKQSAQGCWSNNEVKPCEKLILHSKHFYRIFKAIFGNEGVNTTSHQSQNRDWILIGYPDRFRTGCLGLLVPH